MEKVIIKVSGNELIAEYVDGDHRIVLINVDSRMFGIELEVVSPPHAPQYRLAVMDIEPQEINDHIVSLK